MTQQDFILNNLIGAKSELTKILIKENSRTRAEAEQIENYVFALNDVYDLISTLDNSSFNKLRRLTNHRKRQFKVDVNQINIKFD